MTDVQLGNTAGPAWPAWRAAPVRLRPPCSRPSHAVREHHHMMILCHTTSHQACSTLSDHTNHTPKCVRLQYSYITGHARVVYAGHASGTCDRIDPPVPPNVSTAVAILSRGRVLLGRHRFFHFVFAFCARAPPTGVAKWRAYCVAGGWSWPGMS